MLLLLQNTDCFISVSETISLEEFISIGKVVLKRVQSNSTTLANGSSSITAAIDLVDTTKSFLMFSIQCNDANPSNVQVSGQLTNSTTLTFRRNGTTGNVSIYWYVVEFVSGVSVQRGVADMFASANVNVTISSVDLTKSFPIITAGPWLGSSFGNDDIVKAKLTSATNLNLFYNASTSNPHDVYWQVIQYTESSVQTGDLTMLTGDSSKTATVSSAVAKKSLLIFSYNSETGTTANIGQKMVAGALTNTTTLTFSRLNTGTQIDITWYLIQFTDGTVCQNGTQAFGTSDLTKTVSLSPGVDQEDSMVTSGGWFGRGGSNDYAGDDNPGPACVTMQINSAGNLVLTRAVTGTSLLNVSWFTVQFYTPKPSFTTRRYQFGRNWTQPLRGTYLNRGNSLTSGLVGAWLFNESSGVKLNDYSGFWNNGSITPGTGYWSRNTKGSSYKFDGSSTIIDCGLNESIRVQLPCSLSLWVSFDTVNTYYSLLATDSQLGSYSGVTLGTSNAGGIELDVGSGGGTGSGNRRSINSPDGILSAFIWYHIVGVIRGLTDMSLYLNGVDVGGTYSGTGGALAYEGSTFKIGSNAWGNSFFAGSLSNILLYNRALKPSEARRLYTDRFSVYVPPRSFMVVDGSFSTVNKSEAITVSESVVMRLDDTVNKSEAITLTESVTVSVPFVAISVNDVVTVSESTQFLTTNRVSVSDAITVTESVSVSVSFVISKSDTVTLTESVTVRATLNINVNEAVSLSESVQLAVNIPSKSFLETITITESVTVSNPIPGISFVESLTVSESVTVSNALLRVSLSESITLTESVSMKESIDLSLYETLTVNEFTSVKNTALGPVSIVEAITLNESFQLLHVYLISKVETITLSENVNFFVFHNVDLIETAALTDVIEEFRPYDTIIVSTELQSDQVAIGLKSKSIEIVLNE